MLFKTLIHAIAVGLFTIGASEAANIESQITDEGMNVVIVSGVLQDGDAQSFVRATAKMRDAVVVLDSGGGAVLPALAIGETIHGRGFTTAVIDDRLCASACALIWLAGLQRFAALSSHIGFHAAYRTEDGVTSEAGVGNALIGAYLNQLGLSQDAVVFVTSAPPEGMEWLTPDKVQVSGISYMDLGSSQAPNVETVKPDAARTREQSSAVAAVESFYNALAVADGELASALVVPEKRGVGPFSERSIRTFFGGLREPLRLTDIRQKSPDLVEAYYRYTKQTGSTCDGRAEVQTVTRFDQILISRIKALNGC